MKWLLFAFCVVSILACAASPAPVCNGSLIQVGEAEVPKEYEDKIVITRKPVFLCIRPQDMIQPGP